MRFSAFFAPTLRDDPAEAEVVSHRLLLRAGYIRRVTSGVYDFLPLGLRVLRRIETVVREEMDRAGAQELLMPLVQPAELWQASGRWLKYGPELLRFHDRHGHESCLGPTHEEVICDMVARELKSYRQLPLNLYQIQTKFRDEVRPRFGLMRGREFIMKDAYSFHADEADLAREYDNMCEAYSRIFTRLGLKFRAVEADTGSIGGNASHEFHVLADSGEDVIAHCDSCRYAANVEKARGRRSLPQQEASSALAEVATPGASAVGDVANMLGIGADRLVKTLMYAVSGGPHDGTVVAACVRGDDEVQEIKLAHALNGDGVTLADVDAIKAVGGVAGFAGPQGLRTKVLADTMLQGASGLVAGANRSDAHVTGLDMARDVPDAIYHDLRNVRAGDGCPQCDGRLELSRGIEVGHVFALGRRYAEPMKVEFQDAAGQRAVATMGCYGIGVSRLVAAIVEQCHDEAGIRWPVHLAPFQVSLVSLGTSEAVQHVSRQLYTALIDAGFEVLWDERNERPGVKFKDAELMGIPVKVVVGERGLAEGMVEIGLRGDKPASLPPEDVPAWVVSAMSGAAC
jgi:prolyl-tRNA synthetase